MLKLLDKRYASNRAATRILVLTATYSKKYQGTELMEKYIDDFENYLLRLEKMGSILLSLNHTSPLLLVSWN